MVDSSVVVVVLTAARSCLSSTVVQAENERSEAAARQEMRSVFIAVSLFILMFIDFRLGSWGPAWLAHHAFERHVRQLKFVGIDDYFFSVVVVVVVVFFSSITAAGFTMAFLTMTLDATILSPTFI